MTTLPRLEATDVPISRTCPREILFEEIRRSKPCFDALGIGFSVSRIKVRFRNGRQRRLPYFACCYNVENLGNVNIVAFYYPLIADWALLEGDISTYRRRIRSAIREEMIHAVQVTTVKKRYDQSPNLVARFENAEDYYESLLGRIIDELTRSEGGQRLVLTAAKLYYEDWTINSMEKLRRADNKYHGRDGYLVSELIRQLVQIRFGEPTSEEAKGGAWDKNRIFYVGNFGTTENLLRSMAATLRQTVPELAHMSPTLIEALTEIEETIQAIEPGFGFARL
jgi:hypothetical protein